MMRARPLLVGFPLKDVFVRESTMVSWVEFRSRVRLEGQTPVENLRNGSLRQLIA